MSEEGWAPFPGPQTEFFERGEFEILLGGAAGPGKTDCIIMDAQRYAHVPGYRGIIFRRTFPRLQEIIDRGGQHIEPIVGRKNVRRDEDVFGNLTH